MNASYKPSRFNIFAKTSSGGDVVANTFSQSVSVLEKDEAEALSNIEAKGAGSMTEGLEAAGLIVSSDIDELDLIRKGLDCAKRDPSHATVTVLTTLDCNFNCPYCFQERSRGLMETRVQNLVIQHLSEVVAQLRPKEGHEEPPELGLCFTGGEPLLAPVAIKRIALAARELCEACDVRLRTSMITNGYLLNPEMASLLEALSPSWNIQVTLDGPKETHDARRFLRGGDATYDRIVENVLALSPDVFTVKLRVNVDKTNADAAQEAFSWADELANVVPYVAPVTIEETQSADIKCTCYPPSEWEGFYQHMRSRGLVSTTIEGMLERGSVCSALHGLSCCIDPEGYLYKCFDKCGQREWAYAKLGDPKAANPIRSQMFLGRNAACEQECRDCKYLPQCLGGCPLAWLEKKVHYCAPAKYLLQSELEGAAPD